MATLSIAHPPGWGAERAYVLDVLLRAFLGLDFVAAATHELDSTVELRVREGGGDAGCVRVAECFFSQPESERLQPSTLPDSALGWPAASDFGVLAEAVPASGMPALYGKALPGGTWVREDAAGLRLGIDIFGAAFFMLTRYEEVVVEDRDGHDRFPDGSSVAVKAGFHHRPLVNEYLELLWAALKRCWPRLRRSRRIFAEKLSHDVDSATCSGSLRPLLRAAAGDLTRRAEPGLGMRRLASYARTLGGRRAGDLCDTFDLIMDTSEAQGITSAFYFIPCTTEPGKDGNYALEDTYIRDLLRKIRDRGHEVGFHPSYQTFRDPEQTRREFELLHAACEREQIRQTSWGGRQHYLRWENPTTWRNWDACGLTYDSSLGFAETAGFRCGVCYEYPVFDLLGRRSLTLRERPLIVMDKPLLESLSADAVVREVALMREECRRYCGDFTLLWHNARLTSRREKSIFGRIASVQERVAGVPAR